MADTKDFEGLPLELPICQPVVAAAEGQSQLCKAYIDQLFELAAETVPDSERGETAEEKVVRFKFNRTVVDNETGEVKTMPVEVKAPLLSLVPVPAFTMDEAAVDFSMEVKESEAQKTDGDTESGVRSNYSAWGFSASAIEPAESEDE